MKVATLNWEKDEAHNRAGIWKRDLLILYKDHLFLQASFDRLTMQFTDL
jgi:hypothetical protein